MSTTEGDPHEAFVEWKCRGQMKPNYRTDDPVIFTTSKTSTHPGPRAKEVFASEHGEAYSYQVDKYWRVLFVAADGSLTLITRRGKQHVVEPTDPRLRPARWWERWFYKSRFPQADPATQSLSNGASSE